MMGALIQVPGRMLLDAVTVTSGAGLPVGTPYLHLVASLGVTKDGSDKVSLWEDQTANNFDVDQSTGALQPTYVANALNGEPVLTFGSNYMVEVNTDAATLGPPSGGNQAAVTWFVVANIVATSTGNSFMARDNPGSEGGPTGFRLVESNRTPTFTVSIDSQNSAVRNAATAWGSGVYHLLTCAYDGAAGTMNIYLDGVLDNGTTSGTIPATIFNEGDPFQVGNSGWDSAGQEGDGVNNFAELVIYREIFSAGDLATLHAYFLDKYGL